MLVTQDINLNKKTLNILRVTDIIMIGKQSNDIFPFFTF